MELTKVREQLEQIVYDAANILKTNFSPFGVEAEYKQGSNLASRVVTDTDRNLDAYICRRVGDNFPGMGIRSEEHGELYGELDGKFIIDALDSTLSFHRGLPYSAISIAYANRDGTVLVGVVAQPLARITYSAQLSGGAFLNSRRVELPVLPLKECFIVCCNTWAFLDGRLEKFREAFGFTVTCRSIAYDFATIASGAHDGGVVMRTDIPFDTQAAGLIALEGGAIVTELDGSPWHAQSKTMLVGSPAVHAKLFEIFNP